MRTTRISQQSPNRRHGRGYSPLHAALRGALAAGMAAAFCLLAAPAVQAGRDGEEEQDERASSSGTRIREVLPRQERIKVEMVRDRRNRSMSSVRDRLDRISFTVKLTNQDPAKEFPDLRGIFVVIAQNLVEKKRFVALLKEEFDVKLGKGTNDRTMEWKSRETTTSFYDGYSKFGEEYDGWVFALVDPEGRVIAHKASKESYDQNVEKIGEIQEKSWFDYQLNPVDAAYSANRYLISE
jgi:hypothetical protein